MGGGVRVGTGWDGSRLEEWVLFVRAAAGCMVWR